jgi:hypothetical protein
MRRLGLALSLGALALFSTAGCHKADSYDEGMPETAGYTLEVTGDENGVASNGLGTQQAALSGKDVVGGTFQRTKDAVQAVNDGVHKVLDPLAVLIGSPDYTLEGSARVYAFTHDGVDFKFTIDRILALTFVWKLDAKPQGAADTAFVRVMTGAFKRGDLPRRGRGVIGFDLSAYAGVDASFHGTGQLLVGFAHVAGHKVLRFAAKEFSSDVTKWETVSALFSGWRGPLGGTDVRVAAYANLPETATDAKELGLLHARWHIGIGGRVDAAAAGGDVPADHAIVTFACYRVNDLGREGYLAVADCDATTQSCTAMQTDGQLSDCLPEFLTDETPDADPSTAPLPADAPEDPGLPTSMPSG